MYRMKYIINMKTKQKNSKQIMIDVSILTIQYLHMDMFVDQGVI